MIVFHHNDLDGRCAAAIVGSVYPGGRFVELDYKDRVPLEQVGPYERVFVVDFSLKPPDFALLEQRTADITWIDHHVTASQYDYAQRTDFDRIRGFRDFDEKGRSGCELTWQYLRGGEFAPRAVTLIGDYDAWRLSFAPDCFRFYEGAKLHDHGPNAQLWVELFRPGEDGAAMTAEIISQGQSAIRYRDNYCAEMRKQFGYEVAWCGYRCFAANIYRFGSPGFGDAMAQYDICISYAHNGKTFTVSLYSETVDVSEVAKANGGGGHKGAAGFVCEKLPWIA